MAAAGGAQTRDEQSRPSISLWSLLVRMCIHSPAPYKTDREHNYSAEGRQRLSLSHCFLSLLEPLDLAGTAMACCAGGGPHAHARPLRELFAAGSASLESHP